MTGGSAPVLVTFVLDRSGSMASCREATISGFNEFKATQPAEALFSLTTFNTSFVVEHAVRPVGEVPDLSHGSYVPGGMTALYDAVAYTIANIAQKLETMPKPARHLFVIMTDGEENSSHEFTREQCFDLIKAKEAEGWEFVYLGANQDAYAAAARMGVPSGSTAAYVSTPAGTQAAYHVLRTSAAAFHAGATTPGHFFDDTARPGGTTSTSVGRAPKTPPSRAPKPKRKTGNPFQDNTL